jgi:hypothetical protein
MPSGSRKTITASSNDTPCFAALASAFRRSYSNTHSVYTKFCAMPGTTDQEAAAHAGVWARELSMPLTPDGMR